MNPTADIRRNSRIRKAELKVDISLAITKAFTETERALTDIEVASVLQDLAGRWTDEVMMNEIQRKESNARKQANRKEREANARK